jgi:hypothetical protein
LDGISDQGSGNFTAQEQPPPAGGPPPGEPGYGPPPGAPPGGPPPGPMAPMAPMERPTGVTILAILYFVQGIFWLLVPVMITICLSSLFTLPGLPENGDMDLFSTGMMMCWVVFIIVALFYFIVGFGLLKGKNWARIIAIILAIFGLFNIPIGTIISIIILIYLFKADVKAYFV